MSIDRNYSFQKHSFTDNTSRLQIFAGENETEFLNLQETIVRDTEVPFSPGKQLLRLNFVLGDNHVIQKRKVSSFMSFLGESGGVHGSMMILGAAMHALISGNEQSSHMLKHYFRIEES